MRSERRRTRESLTRSLERIAARIAEAPCQTVEWNDRRLYSRETAAIRAKSLWVAGSYARGAAECGDLDLILKITFADARPPTATIARSLFGTAPDTTLYIGTPEANSSNVAFPEARLVWSEEYPDWKTNISAIVPDPEAGHFARATDRLPLRPDQMATTIDKLERLLELKDRDVLDWEFVDAADIVEDPGAWRSTGRRAESYGAKTRDALQLAICHYAAMGRRGEWRPVEVNERTRFHSEGIFLLTGHPAIPLDQLENPFYDTLALVPHRTRRGPNGIWIIRRASEHPLEKLFAGCRGFYVTHNGEPIRFSDVSYSRLHAATGIELFTDEQDAVDQAETERDFFDDDDDVEVGSAGGSELLKLIAGCDLVVVDGAQMVLSRIGQLASQSGVDEAVEISDALDLARALS